MTPKRPSDEQVRQLGELGGWHLQWSRRHRYPDETTGASGDVEDEFAARARHIMAPPSLARASADIADVFARAAASARQVYLVAGPPTAGKSTLIEQFAGPSDAVADFDAICRSLGSTGPGWDHPYPIRRRAEAKMQDLFDRIAASESGRAWVIRSVPEAGRREALADRVRADRVVLLKPPTNILMRRALERPEPMGTRREIRRWLARYSPSRRDELIESADEFRP